MVILVCVAANMRPAEKLTGVAVMENVPWWKSSGMFETELECALNVLMNLGRGMPVVFLQEDELDAIKNCFPDLYKTIYAEWRDKYENPDFDRSSAYEDFA